MQTRMSGKLKNHKRIIRLVSGILLTLVMVLTDFIGIYPGKDVSAADVYIEIRQSNEQDMRDGTDAIDMKAGKYRLMEDITAPLPLGVWDDTDVVTIDLNGHSLSHYGHAPLEVTEGTLTIEDSSARKDGRINFPLRVSTPEPGTLNVLGGTLSSVTIDAYYVPGYYDPGTVNQSGGKIENLVNNGFCNISGGIIESIDDASSGQLTQTGGHINCTVPNSITYSQQGGTRTGSCYNISFNANGGTVTPNSAITAFDGNAERLTTFPTPLLDGYRFAGWFSDVIGGTPIDTNTVFSASGTIYAHWTEIVSTPPLNPSPQGGSDDYFEDLKSAFESAISIGGAQTVTWNRDSVLDYDIMKLLSENPSITLVFSYTYVGFDYTVTIPGRLAKPDPEIPIYGPLYLYGIYGGTVTPHHEP